MKPLTQFQEQLLQGRARDVERVLEDCFAERMTLVTAEPGTGLTSFLVAGLLPELARRGDIVIYWRDWQGRYFADSFREAIAAAVRTQADPDFFAEAESLNEMLERIRFRTGRGVVLLLDDFHEYLRCHRNSDLSDSFDAEISCVLAARNGRSVLGIHEGSLGDLERMRPHVPNLTSHRHPLYLLSPEEAKDMVRLRAEAAGFEVEPALLELLLQGEPNVKPSGCHPFYLSIAVDRLADAEQRLKSHVLRASTLTLNKGAATLVFESLDAGIGELSSSHRELFFRWCNILITDDKETGGKKRAAITEKDLTEYAGKMNRFVLTALPQLTGGNILRQVDVAGTLRYEISRECLVPIIRNWWERRETAIIARRRAIFRVTSVSLAAGSILLVYVVYLLAPFLLRFIN